MRFFWPRLRRILYAFADPTSYQLLWGTVFGRFVFPNVNDECLQQNEREALDVEGPNIDRQRISPIIFQTTEHRREMSKQLKYWSRSFQINNPAFSCLLWEATDDRRFIEARYLSFLTRYDSYPQERYRLDIIRSFFLYSYGGFYAHMDSECLKPLKDFLHAGDVLLGRMGQDDDFEQSITNSVMASKPNQAFWLLTIAIAMERLAVSQKNRSWASPEEMTGPILLKDAVNYYMTHDKEEVIDRIRRACPELRTEAENSDFGSINLLAPSIWCPINWNNFIQMTLGKRIFREAKVIDKSAASRLFPHAYVVTYWDKHN